MDIGVQMDGICYHALFTTGLVWPARRRWQFVPGVSFCIVTG